MTWLIGISFAKNLLETSQKQKRRLVPPLFLAW